MPSFSRHFKALPNDKILDWPKLKSLADDNLNVAKMMISLYGRAENIMVKRRKWWLPAFSPFPTMFSERLPPQGR